MHAIRAVIRLFITVVALFLTTLAILMIAWLPFTYRGIPVPAWMATALSRFYLRLFRVRLTYHHPERLHQYEGFIFPNHVSFLDILIMLHHAPARFLSKAELREWPFIGWIARAIGTVFVDRSNKSSREAAREALSRVNHFPPVILFPEGGIFAPPDKLKPFRYGAFEIAHQGGVPYLPCVMLYDPLDITFWGDESIITAAWRFAGYGGAIHVDVYLLRQITPGPEDDPHQLALETHGAMNAVFQYGGHEEDVLQSGL